MNDAIVSKMMNKVVNIEMLKNEQSKKIGIAEVEVLFAALMQDLKEHENRCSMHEKEITALKLNNNQMRIEIKRKMIEYQY